MAERRHLPVVQESAATEDAPRSRVYVLLVSAAVILLAWTLLAAVLNGAIGIAAIAGPIVVSVSNLFVLFVSACFGGAIARVLDARAAPAVVRVAGAVAASVGWFVAFAWRVAGEVRDARAVAIWLAVLAVMAGAAAGGAEVGRRASHALGGGAGMR